MCTDLFAYHQTAATSGVGTHPLFTLLLNSAKRHILENWELYQYGKWMFASIYSLEDQSKSRHSLHKGGKNRTKQWRESKTSSDSKTLYSQFYVLVIFKRWCFILWLYELNCFVHWLVQSYSKHFDQTNNMQIAHTQSWLLQPHQQSLCCIHGRGAIGNCLFGISECSFTSGKASIVVTGLLGSMPSF